MGTLKTDMNQRERQEFAAAFRKMSEEAREVARYLVEEDDSKLVIHFLLFGLMQSSAAKLQDILIQAADVAKATTELEEGERIE